MSWLSIRWQLTIPYVLLTLLAVLGITVYTSIQIRRTYLDSLEEQLLTEAELIAELDSIGGLDSDSGSVRSLLLEGGDARATEVLKELAREWSLVSEKRVAILDAEGTVLATSHDNPAQVDNKRYQAEVQEALRRGEGSEIRFNREVGYDALHAAVAVRDADTSERVLGFVHIAVSLQEVDEQLRSVRKNILGSVLLIALFIIGLNLLITNRIVTPVGRLTKIAERLAKGDMNARIMHIGPNDEVAKLSQTFNYMADQLRDKVAILAEERSQLSAVLKNMADGAIITDETGKVMLINPSAAKLLDTVPEKALGRSFAQVAYHHQLIELWKRCQSTGEEQTQAVETGHQGLFIQAIVSPLRETDKQRFLMILQDLTRIRRLETVRRDFISNISHELRTPLASLKVVVETLQDGAIEDPPAAKRFLHHIETEVNALAQMVQELLGLSRIESGKAGPNIQPTSVHAMLHSPIERLRPQAERAGLSLTLVLQDDLPPVRADSEQMRQVITNLVHNAIKFTLPGGDITVSAEIRVEDEVLISVRDTGVGIPEEDLPRIFERFYKADRARSGGGTGLGLAIAKHVVHGHQGRIWAESVEGKGSTFYFTLPRAN
jgi:two-component system phosphate regulon sensor histidine kinase PhoR